MKSIHGIKVGFRRAAQLGCIITLVAGLIGSRSAYANEIVNGDNEPRTIRREMHACPPERFVTGVNAAKSFFICSNDFGGYVRWRGGIAEFVDGKHSAPTQRSGMHACPPNTAVSGIDASKDLLLCVKVYGQITAEQVDGDDETPTTRNDMHACPLGQVLLGIDVGKNHLLCGTYLSRAMIDPVRVAVYINRMQATATGDTPSSNTRDEVYVLVRGTILQTRSDGSVVPAGTVNARLPRFSAEDDYYEFSNGNQASANDYTSWTNFQQSPVGPPIIWEGELFPGQSAKFSVIIGEQDNKDPPDIQEACAGAAGVASKVPLDAFKIGSEIGNGICDLIPHGAEQRFDDVIGAFVVTLVNDAGTVRTTWTPLGEYEWPGGLKGATTRTEQSTSLQQDISLAGSRESIMKFTFRGTGGANYDTIAGKVGSLYDATAKVEVLLRPPALARRYLGSKTSPVQIEEACGQERLLLDGRQINKGAVGEALLSNVIIPGNEDAFRWICGGSNEESGYADGTDLVVIHRRKSDRRFGIYYFALEPFSRTE